MLDDTTLTLWAMKRPVRHAHELYVTRGALSRVVIITFAADRRQQQNLSSGVFLRQGLSLVCNRLGPMPRPSLRSLASMASGTSWRWNLSRSNLDFRSRETWDQEQGSAEMQKGGVSGSTMREEDAQSDCGWRTRWD